MLKFGWSRKNISIDGPIGIVGQFHERISQGIIDDITLSALVIDDGNTVSIMMSADLLKISDGLIFEVRDAVKQKNPQIPVENILFSATHTHTSPRYFKFGTAEFDRAPHDKVEYMMPEIYRSLLVDRASDAVVEAYESRSEGSFAYGYSYAVVAHHRRSVFLDDLRDRAVSSVPRPLMTDKHAKMYGKTDDPMFLGYEGNVDSVAYFLFTFDKEEKLTGVIVNVPCPSQNSENEEKLSADYWAQVRQLIKQKYGDIYVLPQCASAGDMSPRILHGRIAEDRKYALKYQGIQPEGVIRPKEIFNRMEIAERIVSAMDDAYSWASKEKICDAKLGHTVRNVKLEAWKITKEQYEAAKEVHAQWMQGDFVHTDDPYDDFTQNTRRATMLCRYENIIERYEKDYDFYNSEIHCISLGDVAFVSNPFELYISYQHRIQARSPFVQTFAVQLAAVTGIDGYLCTEPAMERLGYGANIYSNFVAPKGGDTLVEETLKELFALREE